MNFSHFIKPCRCFSCFCWLFSMILIIINILNDADYFAIEFDRMICLIIISFLIRYAVELSSTCDRESVHDEVKYTFNTFSLHEEIDLFHVKNMLDHFENHILDHTGKIRRCQCVILQTKRVKINHTSRTCHCLPANKTHFHWNLFEPVQTV